MKSNSSLIALSPPQLLHRFADLVRCHRRCTAQMLAVIDEIDRRKLWAAHACPSMFAFCVKYFHMSEAMTAKRIWAARTARRFPAIFDMVAKGELHLSGIQQLAKHLTDDNHRELLERAKHKSSREIEELVAEIAPQPDCPSRVRALPRRGAGKAGGASVAGGGDQLIVPVIVPVIVSRDAQVVGRGSSDCERSRGGAAHNGSRPAGVESALAEPTVALPEGQTPTPEAPQGGTGTGVTPPPRTLRSAVSAITSPAAGSSGNKDKAIVALSPRRYKITITVDQDTRDKLRMLEDLPGGQPSNCDPAVIVSRALDVLLRQTLKKKAAVTDRSHRPRARSEVRPGDRPPARPHDHAHDRPLACGDEKNTQRTRSIPAAVRRRVWQRDAGRCAFVDERGNRCAATRAVEYHHIRPYGKNGGHQTDNIALRCRAHNQYQADLDFGRAFMDRKRGARTCRAERGKPVGHAQ